MRTTKTVTVTTFECDHKGCGLVIKFDACALDALVLARELRWHAETASGRSYCKAHRWRAHKR